MPTDLPVLILTNATAWAQWLAREAATSSGVWLTLAKKGVTDPTSLTYAQALDEALCHGWIDGQARSRDESTYSHRFTPRTAKSIWSKRNVGHIARLEGEGRMQARGSSEVEKAKADGRWDAAYAGPATMEPPAELLAAIAKESDAQALWDILTKQNRYALCFRLGNIKTEAGRQKRIAAFVDMLASGKTPYPQKRSIVVSQTASTAPKATSGAGRAPRAGGSTRRSVRLRKAPSSG